MNQSQPGEANLALFIDFDNVALGARDAGQRFDVKLLLQRVLEKGKIVVKRAYADWHYYKEHMTPIHESAIEMIEIPTPKISGKNSADIRLVVDAMDLCYSKDHIDTFVIVSGDSDFSPLVSKLRENAKRVIGIGVRNSSSKLLIANCDEFIFYDDLYATGVGQTGKSMANVPGEKRDLFDFLISTSQSLLQESRGVLYSSLIKDTMKRKRPDFNEANYGYSTFGDLLDDAKHYGLLVVERDARAGGTWVVQGLGAAVAAPPVQRGGTRSGRSRRRRGRRKSGTVNGERTAEVTATPSTEGTEATAASTTAGAPDVAEARSSDEKKAAKKVEKKAARKTEKKAAKKVTRKKAAKKTAKKAAKKTGKKAAKKTATKAAGKTTAKKTPRKSSGRTAADGDPTKAGSGGKEGAMDARGAKASDHARDTEAPARNPKAPSRRES